MAIPDYLMNGPSELEQLTEDEARLLGLDVIWAPAARDSDMTILCRSLTESEKKKLHSGNLVSQFEFINRNGICTTVFGRLLVPISSVGIE